MLAPASVLILIICVFSLFFLVSSARDLSTLLIFFKEPTFKKIDFLYCFCFQFCWFCRCLYYLLFFWSIWVYVAHFFPSRLRYKLKLLIWDFSSFVMYVFNAINFPLRTGLAVSFRLDILYFHFHSNQYILKFPFTLPLRPMDYLELFCLFCVWRISYHLSIIHFQFNSVMVREYTEFERLSILKNVWGLFFGSGYYPVQVKYITLTFLMSLYPPLFTVQLP